MSKKNILKRIELLLEELRELSVDLAREESESASDKAYFISTFKYLQGLVDIYENNGEELSIREENNVEPTMESKKEQLKEEAESIATHNEIVEEQKVEEEPAEETLKEEVKEEKRETAKPSIFEQLSADLEEVKPTSIKNEKQEVAEQNSSSKEVMLNEKLAKSQEDMLLNRLQSQAISNLLSAFTLNDKLRFTKGLFKNSQEDFQAFVKQVNECQSFSEASTLLKESVQEQPGIKDFGELKAEMESLLQRRFTIK